MRWLLDEMLPPAAVIALASLGHDASSVRESGLAGATDVVVLEHAVRESRIMVTENVADFATLLEDRLARGEPCVPVVFVRRQRLPKRGALPDHLGRLLDDWAHANPHPYIGLHWPAADVPLPPES